MLTYKAAYRWESGVCIGEVLDFPGTVSFGNTLEESRKNLAGALEDMAETNLIQGEALPIPDSAKTDILSEIEEPIYLVIHAGHQVNMQVASK